MNIKSSLVLLAALSLGGCASYMSQEAGRIDPADFGEANRMTYAAMVVDPDPQYDAPMESSGEVASDAVDAYREGNVEEPSIGGSSGGGMGGSMGGSGFSGGTR